MNDHYFSKNPKSKPNIKEIEINTDINFKIYSANGLFSKNNLDIGTSVLLKYIEYKPFSTILDYGCGNGIIGIYLKLKEPTLNIYATDINSRALKITKMNIDKFKFGNFHTITTNQLTKNKAYTSFFDSIYLNPPMSSGMVNVKQMFSIAHNLLKPKGFFQVVVRTNKGSKLIKSILEETFNEITISGKGSGFRVFKATK